MHRHIQGRFGLSINAIRSSYPIYFKESKKAWRELCYTWIGIIRDCLCFDNVETLSYWTQIQTKKWSQWITIHFFHSDLNRRQTCWSELLSEYDFEITYIKGTINRLAGVSTQRPHIFSVIPLKKNLPENIWAL